MQLSERTRKRLAALQTRPTWPGYPSKPEKPQKSRLIMPLLPAVLIVSLALVLTGCAEKPLLVKPCPVAPLPPPELMTAPRNLSLVPEVLRPRASTWSAPQPVTPTN